MNGENNDVDPITDYKEVWRLNDTEFEIVHKTDQTKNIKVIQEQYIEDDYESSELHGLPQSWLAML